MASLFAKAVSKTVTEAGEAKASSNGQLWIVGDAAGDEVGKAVHELIVLKASRKTVEAKEGVYKPIVKKEGNRRLIAFVAANGVLPETPMKIQNGNGEQVGYVLQDRSGQYGVTPEQKLILGELLGEDVAGSLLYTEVSFKFNRDVMAKPGVSEALDKILQAAIAKLVKSGVLAEEDELVQADVKESFKPGTLSRIGQLCGSDTEKIGSFLEIGGSSFTRFVLP